MHLGLSLIGMGLAMHILVYLARPPVAMTVSDIVVMCVVSLTMNMRLSLVKLTFLAVRKVSSLSLLVITHLHASSTIVSCCVELTNLLIEAGVSIEDILSMVLSLIMIVTIIINVVIKVHLIFWTK